MKLSVAQAYRSNGDGFTTDTKKTGAALRAAKTAKGIVAKYEGQSDYAKMRGYLKEIEDLTAYNDAALDPGTPYGDPWQLIYVFDGDKSTNVVCEGYAKAFQYLMDQSSFSGKIESYIVTGTMGGGTGEGPHMWNIVSIDGQNYLVDVTNSDTGTIGAPDKLFLVGNPTIKDGTQYFLDGESTTPMMGTPHRLTRRICFR